MWKQIMNKISKLLDKSGKSEKKKPAAPKIYKSLAKNKKYLQDLIGDSDDIILKEINIGGKKDFKGLMIFVEGMIDKKIIDEQVLSPLMYHTQQVEPEIEITKENFSQIAEEFIISIDSTSLINSFDNLILEVLSGATAVLFDGCKQGLIVKAVGWEGRGVEEPTSESVIRGSRDGFSERLRVNTVLLRRRIRDPNLKIASTHIGRRTKTEVALAYIEGIANEEVIDEVKKRLDTIDTDAILESGYIEELIEDSHHSPFPQMINTERPDKAASYLLEGKVVILIDNTPVVLIVPATFNSLYQSPEDYNERWLVMSAVRLLRFVSIFITLLAPSLFIALTSFHPGMIPGRLVISIAATREGVPFPALAEALLMEFTIELLREAGIRLPAPMGQTIGIVGGLVIGQAAVSAGIASPIMVIIVSITAIASFVAPNYSIGLALRFIRFGFMLLASLLGLFGIMLGIIGLLIHLVTLKSFGVAYLSPFAPYYFSDWKDTLVRIPLSLMTKRPLETAPQDPDRQDIERENNKWGEEDND